MANAAQRHKAKRAFKRHWYEGRAVTDKRFGGAGVVVTAEYSTFFPVITIRVNEPSNRHHGKIFTYRPHDLETAP